MKQLINSFPINKKMRIKQNGISLVIVMIVLTVVSILGVAGIQISGLGEKSARNDRDLQIAFQSAEAALLDAEFDITGTNGGTRGSVFADSTAFVDGCGASGQSLGLCTLQTIPGKPAWLKVDFTKTDSTAKTVEFGAFTGRPFYSGAAGIQPAKKPRYVIEQIPSSVGTPDAGDRSAPTPALIYRVTAMGFGPREDIQAVLQATVR